MKLAFSACPEIVHYFNTGTKSYFQNEQTYQFTELSVSHKMDLFDKLITPILNYASEVWGFDHGKAIERVHLQFCKQIHKVKRSTQNDFVYGELGRIEFQCMRYFNIIIYW